MFRPSGPTTSRRTRYTSNSGSGLIAGKRLRPSRVATSARKRGATTDGSPPFPGAAPFARRAASVAWGFPRPGSDPQLSQLVQPDLAGILLSRRDVLATGLVRLRAIASLAEECVARCDERCSAQQIDSELANRTLLCAAVLTNAEPVCGPGPRPPSFGRRALYSSKYRAGESQQRLMPLREAFLCAKICLSGVTARTVESRDGAVRRCRGVTFF